MSAAATLPLTDDWQVVPDGMAIGVGADVSMGLGGKTFARRHLDGRPISADPPGWAELRALLMRSGGFGYWWLASQAKNDEGQALEKSTTWWAMPYPADLPRDSGPDGARNLYFGVNPVGSIPKRISKKSGKPIPQAFVRATEEDVCAVNCVFAEFDLKDFDGDFAKILTHIGALPLRPSVAIYSGGGIHCYWIFEQPISILSDDNRKRAKDLQAGWVNFVGSDNTVKDLARVLRVPGTLNYKYSPPRPVSFAWCELERLFDPEKIRALLPKPSPNSHKPAATAPNHLDDQELLNKAQSAKNGAGFAQLWQGGVNGHRSHSEADLALCSMLAFWTGADASRMDRLFRASGLMRDKWDQTHNGDGMTYGEMTIQKAIQGTTNTYSPNGHGAPALPDGATALPEIVVNGRNLWEVTGEALAALYAANTPPVLFVRAGMVTQIRRDERGRPVVEMMSTDAMRGRMARVASFIKITEKKDETVITAVTPPLDVVRDVLSIGAWKFPRLAGVIETPALRPDGSVIMAPGYDLATGLFLAPADGLQVGTIADQPSAAEVAEALALLREPWADYPFADDASSANALALALTPIVRPAIEGPIPVALINAPQPGSGKGLAVEIVSIQATGRAALMTPLSKGEELRKSITSLLLESAPIICFDNLSGMLYSPILAAAVTAREWKDRVLGESKSPSLPQRAVWIVTGNAIQLGGDMPRRCYSINIDAKQSQPWTRSGFRHPDLEGWVRDHRGQLIGAALTLARAWYAAGCPGAGVPTIGGFPDWPRVVGGILTHAGVRGFLGNLREMYAEADEESAQWEGFLLALGDKFSEPATVAAIAKALHDEEALRDLVPDLGEEVLDAKGEIRPRFKQALGLAFRRRNGRRHGESQARVEQVKRHKKSKTPPKWLFQVGDLGDLGDSIHPPENTKHVTEDILYSAGSVSSPQSPQVPPPAAPVFVLGSWSEANAPEPPPWDENR